MHILLLRRLLRLLLRRACLLRLLRLLRRTETRLAVQHLTRLKTMQAVAIYDHTEPPPIASPVATTTATTTVAVVALALASSFLVFVGVFPRTNLNNPPFPQLFSPSSPSSSPSSFPSFFSLCPPHHPSIHKRQRNFLLFLIHSSPSVAPLASRTVIRTDLRVFH
jgi:hypothetical protein